MGADSPHYLIGDKLQPGIFRALNSLSAEVQYFQLIRFCAVQRYSGIIRIDQLDKRINPACYYTGPDWTGRREQEIARYQAIWGTPDEGWRPPSRPLIQAVLTSAQISQAAGASLVGVDQSSMRRWLQGTRLMPYSAWFTLLIKTGHNNYSLPHP